MGACGSVHKQFKTDEVVIPEPIINGDRPIAEADLKSSQWSQSHSVTTVRDLVSGSKEETFFDSQAWLESDCDDDFLSVNGDFTPSRGTTPVHQSFSARTPRGNGVLLDDKTPGSKPEPSPTSKKRLSELFCDSLRSNEDIDDQNMSGNQNGKTEDKVPTIGLSPNGTPFVYEPEKENQLIKSVQCCLPRMLSTRSYRERRKKTSPTHSLG